VGEPVGCPFLSIGNATPPLLGAIRLAMVVNQLRCKSSPSIEQRRSSNR